MKRVFLAFAVLSATAGAAPAQSSDTPWEKQSIEEQRRFFTEDAVAPTIKPKGHDVTIVEYLDYQCPHCRASHEPLKQLLAKDKKVRVIFRDWPIFGPASERAARVAIATKYQGRHEAIHDALMTTPMPLTESKIQAAAKKAGVDWAQLEKDLKGHSDEIEALLGRNSRQAEMLGMEGTPVFIIGNVQTFGSVDLNYLEDSVGKAREAKSAEAITSNQPSGL